MKKTLCLFIILVMCLCLIPAYAYNESSKDIIPQPSLEPGPTIGPTLSPIIPTDDPHLIDPLGPDIFQFVDLSLLSQLFLFNFLAHGI